MDFEELLKSLGYTDDQIKSIKDEMKKRKIYLSNEENSDIRISKLQEDFNAKDKELTAANELVKSLQDSAKNNDVEGMKTKIDNYEKQIAQLQEEIKEEKIKGQLAIELKDAGVIDENYIAFKIEQKLKEENKSFELTEDGRIKGIKELIDSEKKAFPTFFKSESKREVQVKELGKQQDDKENDEPKDFKEAVRQVYDKKNNSEI